MERNRLASEGLGTLVRLMLLSIVVGVVLSALGITPFNILDQIALIARRIYDMGFGAIEWALRYFLLGAVVVVPVWLLSRLLAGRRRRDGDR